MWKPYDSVNYFEKKSSEHQVLPSLLTRDEEVLAFSSSMIIFWTTTNKKLFVHTNHPTHLQQINGSTQ